MEKKYIIPATTLIAGILIWVIFIIVYDKAEITSISEVSLGVISGGLFIYSAYRCRRVGGPKGGNVFRASLLLVLAISSYWLIGSTTTILLLAASVIILLLILKKSEEVSKIAGV